MDQSYVNKPSGNSSRKSHSPESHSQLTVDNCSTGTLVQFPRTKNFNVREVLALVGGGKATHYNRLNPKSPYYDELYPRPVKNGRLSIFIASEVATYLASRIAIRDNDP